MNDKQRTFGQYETPVNVADTLLAFCLRRPQDRVLDPSCGNGAFLARAAQLQAWLNPDRPPVETLWGVELDPDQATVATSSLPQATIINRNFFRLLPGEKSSFDGQLFDAIIGNPPYTRAEWIDRLDQEDEVPWQAAFFKEEKDQDAVASRAHHHPILNRRSGLHAYFLVHGTSFLREGGRLGFVVPNSWLDVAYGERLKQFLLDHYRILAIVESSVERWFSDARVNTCLIVLEKSSNAGDRSANKVRLVMLQQPIQELIPMAADNPQRLSILERLSSRLLPGTDSHRHDLQARVITQSDLKADERWGVAMRAPTIYRLARQTPNLVPLSNWASIQRGYTTGANAFFYLEHYEIDRWQIEPEFRQPLLKSLRHISRRALGKEDCNVEVLTIPAETDLTGSHVDDYIAWGEENGWHLRRTCASRQPWYSLPEQEPASMLLAKGIWQRHFVPLLVENVLVDQQIYRLRLADGVSPLAAAAILNSAWLALQMELNGRINFGEGVLWLAAYEVLDLRVPDPRYLPPGQLAALEDVYEPLLELPVKPTKEELAHPGWQVFHSVASEIVHFSAEEVSSIIDSLQQRIAVRQQKASKLSV